MMEPLLVGVAVFMIVFSGRSGLVIDTYSLVLGVLSAGCGIALFLFIARNYKTYKSPLYRKLVKYGPAVRYGIILLFWIGGTLLLSDKRNQLVIDPYRVAGTILMVLGSFLFKK